MTHHNPLSRTILPALLASVILLAGCGAVDAQRVRNMVEYQVRKTFPPVLVYRTPPSPASLGGVVRDEAGQPIADEDTTHYLDAYNPTQATRRVFERVLGYVRQVGSTSDE